MQEQKEMIKLLLPVPVGTPVIQRFGEHQLDYSQYGLVGHNGIDYGVMSNTQITVAAAGKVIKSERNKDGYGELVKIDHGRQIYTLYGHLNKRLVKVGDTVRAGGLVGLSGSTGNSTGPHLHFECRAPGGPAGYNGAIDPEPWLELDTEPIEPPIQPPIEPGTPVEIPAFPVLVRAQVIADTALNVRSGPGKDNPLVGQLQPGWSLAVLAIQQENGNIWAQIGWQQWCAFSYQGDTYMEWIK